MASPCWEILYNEALHSEENRLASNLLAVQAILERLKVLYFDLPATATRDREQHMLLRALCDLRVLRICCL